tara:strand:+ start:2001 stop:3017 length:1017 start_codon:yes stop_codon:yes gene_type:complete
MHKYPCKGGIEKVHNGKSYYWLYELKPGKLKKVQIKFSVKWDRHVITHVVDNVDEIALDSPHGVKCNYRICLDPWLYASVKRIWRIPKQTPPAHLQLEVTYDCETWNGNGLNGGLGNLCNLGELKHYFSTFLESFLSRSPIKAIDAQVDTGLYLLFQLINALPEHHKDPVLDKNIRDFCTYIVDNFDDEIDHFILASNKVTTRAQLFQEGIDKVKDGIHWREAFCFSSKFSDKTPEHNGTNHLGKKTTTKKQTTTEVKLTTCAPPPTRLPGVTTYYHIEDITDIEKDVGDIIHTVNDMYNLVFGKEPSTDEILYYVTMIQNGKIRIDFLKTFMERQSV